MAALITHTVLRFSLCQTIYGRMDNQIANVFFARFLLLGGGGGGGGGGNPLTEYKVRVGLGLAKDTNRWSQ